MKSYLNRIGAAMCRALLEVFKGEDGAFSQKKIVLAAISFVAYTLLFGWKFAFLLMVSVGLHESGHVWAMNKVGVRSSGSYFIPFVGGVAISNNDYEKLSDKVIVAIMGPLWGMLLALVALFGYLATGNPILCYTAWWQAIFNLFNLMPANIFDGGQLLGTIASSIGKNVGHAFRIASVLLIAVLFGILKNPLILLITVVAAQDAWRQYKYGETPYGNKLSKMEMAISFVSYIVLAIILFFIMAVAAVSGDVPFGQLEIFGQ